ncbi:MAG: hypothetical protein F4X27_06010 [Chloroflexi bacterium]|nr:hypothetical protein [Chloroflexota bacterium]
MNFVDPYTFRARVQPALIVVLPAGFLLFALLPDHPFFVAAFFGLLGAAGGTSIVAQVGRDRGLRKQSDLWKSWGGPPTTRLLRHRRQPGDPELSPGLRRQVEEWTGYSLPTEQEEEACPSQADEKYEEVVKSLLEATRDRDRFPLVFAEVVNYGFRRNLWGLRPIGAPTAVALASFSWALLVLTVWGRPWPDPWWDIIPNPDSVAVIRLAVAIADTGLAAFWVFWVKKSWVKTVADVYASRLVESVQTLRSS